MKSAIYLASLFILFFSQIAGGQAQRFGHDSPRLSEIETPFLAQNNSSLKQRVETSLAGQSPGERKSIQKAFLLSAILPGAGEFYMGSKTRMLIFGGIEVLSWTGYLTYHHKGKDKEDEFRKFADEHWSLDDYIEFINTEFLDGTNWRYEIDNYNPDDWDSIHIYLPPSFIHDVIDAWLHDKQQYYEMIGKYYEYQFGGGWDDNTQPSDTLYQWLSGRAEHYEDMRDESNKFLKRAKWGIGAALVNRVLSAFDAALLARSHNKRADRFSGFRLKAKVVDYCGEPIPQLILTKRF